MKNKLQHIVAIMLIATLSFTYASAQSGDPFIIKKPFKRSTYHGRELRTMSKKEISIILMEDPVAFSKWKGGNTLANIGLGFASATSLTIIAAPLIVPLALELVALPLAIGGSSKMKNAIRMFNNHE